MIANRSFSRTQKLELYMRSNGKCCLCGCQISVDNFEADHIIPWSKGGKTVLTNGQALCKSCNQSKSATMTVPYHNHLPAGWTLRSWQEEFIQRFVTEAIRQCTLDPCDIQAFILHAFPGSGKSLAQALAAKVLLRGNLVEEVQNAALLGARLGSHASCGLSHLLRGDDMDGSGLRMVAAG